MHSPAQSAPGNCTSRLSARELRARNLLLSSTAPPDSSSLMASIELIPRRISRSRSSRQRSALFLRFRCEFPKALSVSCAGSELTCARTPASSISGPTVCFWPTAILSRPSSWCGRPELKGPDFLADLDGLETSRSNQLVVAPTLQTTRDPNIFAIGDCAFLVDARTARPIPPRAQAAHQQAIHQVKQLHRRLQGNRWSPFHTGDFGSLVSLGEYTTVGNLMGFVTGKGLFLKVTSRG